MERGAWWATVHGVTKSWTILSDSHTHKHIHIYTYSVYLHLHRIQRDLHVDTS